MHQFCEDSQLTWGAESVLPLNELSHVTQASKFPVVTYKPSAKLQQLPKLKFENSCVNDLKFNLDVN